MAKGQHPACRLYVILARRKPSAVVFRRGPSKRVQVLKWTTDTDTIEEGQWFHGRIYERRCDLSPDGTKLIYFAQKINARSMKSDYTYAWTGVSRPPFLTALALWPKGDCWNGGGLFETSGHVLLNHAREEATAHPDHRPPKGLRVTPGTFARGEDEPIASVRKTRDGWKLIQAGRYPWARGGPRTERKEIWEKRSPGSTATLVESLDALDFERPGGPYLMSYVVRRKGITDIPVEGAQWADWDQSGRLVFARGGCLLGGKVGPEGLREAFIVDFCPRTSHAH